MGETEKEMEMKLIHQLTQKASQWTFRDDLRTISQLWQNFREILVRHNKDLFDEHPLTDAEFQQVQNQLRFLTPYDAAKWLIGENGIARVDVQREDASLGTVHPEVFRREDIAGGTSVYEVVHQMNFLHQGDMNRDRRGDVTLLINGLPMIHIELKSRKHPYMEAFYQIRKYVQENVFRDIFTTLQMFVVTNGSDTRYFAASRSKPNEKFLSTWLDSKNQPVTDYLAFAQDVLSIPAAHRLVTQYTVLDSEQEKLILLRPYQIHAIEAVMDAVNPYTDGGSQSGYIWHTTGSGKTLTSYKTARNLTRIPSVEKVVFVVDRKDLDSQTTGAFQAYAEYDTIDVDETDNVNELVQKLLSNGELLITTIQKIQHVMRRYPKGSAKYEKLHPLHLIFVVDECHRAVSPQAQFDINHYFVNPLWYGFTGTPIFEEDAKKSAGNLPKTTEEQYGKCLNRYTIREALHDKSVLGFQVDYRHTFDLKELARKNNIEIPQNDESGCELEKALMKKGILEAAYEDKQHMLQVVDTIINHSIGKLGLKRGPGNNYTAILTTSSIKKAQRYYELFQRVKNGKEPRVTVHENIKKMISDFPKVAITYSIGENQEGGLANQEKMKASLADYNAMFGMKYAMDSIEAYNRNVNDRLARKKAKYQSREEQLDLVIVVDRLLTGFDAPSLSTLFIDRMPMRSYNLLQAFSRTNRLFDQQKRFGQIVTFEVPAHFKKAVDHAMLLYSNGGGNYVQAPTWEEAWKKYREAKRKLLDIAPTPAHVDGLSKQQKFAFLKAIREFDNAYADIQVYPEYEDFQSHGTGDENAEYVSDDTTIGYDDDAANQDLDDATIEEYGGKAQNIREELKSDADDYDIEINTNLFYEPIGIHVDQIDEDYILNLMESTRTTGEESTKGAVLFLSQDAQQEKTFGEIQDGIDRMRKSNPARAELLEEIWQEYLDNPAAFHGVTFADVLNKRVNKRIQQLTDDFAQEWCVKADKVRLFLDSYDASKDPKEKQINQDALKKATNAKAYREKHPDSHLGLKYWRKLLEAFHGLYIKQLQKLLENNPKPKQ